MDSSLKQIQKIVYSRELCLPKISELLKVNNNYWKIIIIETLLVCIKVIYFYMENSPQSCDFEFKSV